METKLIWNLEKPGKELQPDQCHTIHTQIQRVFWATKDELRRQK